MHQAAQTAGQPVGTAELTKQHGDELGPASETLGGALATMFLDQSGKLGPRKMLEQLIEQAGYLYDCLALLVGDVWRSSRQGLLANAHYRRALSLSYLTAGTVLDKGGPASSPRMRIFHGELVIESGLEHGPSGYTQPRYGCRDARRPLLRWWTDRSVRKRTSPRSEGCGPNSVAWHSKYQNQSGLRCRPTGWAD
jgi:hypothetical protein